MTTTPAWQSEPHPGSLNAVLDGCKCPRMDNGHGSVSLARDRGGWVIVSDCPLHGVGGWAPAEIPAQGDHQTELPHLPESETT